MKPKPRARIDASMYALSPPINAAWHDLLSPLPQHLVATQVFDHSRGAQVSFSGDDEVFNSRALLLAHTCGYPWLRRWRNTHKLVAVAEFDVDGADGKYYSSWLVCQRNNQHKSLVDFADHIAAINNLDSNSGMNAFRHAIAPLARNGCFFKKVLISGSHLASIDLIISGQANIAAIDCVSWHFFKRLYPQKIACLAIVGQTDTTCGLPFITDKQLPIDTDAITSALNKCRQRLNPAQSSLLPITKFAPVDNNDYLKIAHLEQQAANLGYTEIR